MGTKEEKQLVGLAASLGDEKTKPPRGVVSRIWGAMGLVGHLFFRNSKDDFEKRLQHLSKEEVAAHTRLKRRTQFWRKFARNLIVYSVIAEILLLGIAIYSTRNVHMDWQTRAWRVSPVFALPLFTTLVYSSCGSIYRMRERKDHRTLELLRAERQEKIDELKEKTNYYLTQQLIQKYDVDPAAKAAAASVLASKLGSESGLKLALQAADAIEKEDAGKSPRAGQSNDFAGIERGDSPGLRNRRSYSRKGSRTDKRSSFSPAQTPRTPTPVDDISEEPEYFGSPDVEVTSQKEEYTRGRPGDGGWLARLAAMLVGEDPSQCYALICGQCHMHNGLAKKEDFQYITYYCPHCHALNKANHLEDNDAKDQSGRGTESPIKHVARPDEGRSTLGESSTQLQDQMVSEILTDLEVLPEAQESRDSQDESPITPSDK